MNRSINTEFIIALTFVISFFLLINGILLFNTYQKIEEITLDFNKEKIDKILNLTNTEISVLAEDISIQSNIENKSIILNLFLTLIIGSIIIATICGYFLYLMIKKDVLIPIKKLEDVSNSLFEGEFKEIIIKKDNEIGRLTNSFNKLYNKIHTDKAKLENEIEKRTIDLNQNITELEKFSQLTIDREIKMIEMKKALEKLRKDGKNKK